MASLIQDPSQTIDQFVDDLQVDKSTDEGPMDVSVNSSTWEVSAKDIEDQIGDTSFASTGEESMDSITDQALNRELEAFQERERLGLDKADSMRLAEDLEEEFAVERFKSEADPNDERFQEGYLVWAKLKGYSYWPAVVTVDPVDALTVKFKFSPTSRRFSRSHVHFLAYPNQRAWVHENSIIQFKGLKAYQAMAKTLGPKRSKDFFPTRKYQEHFNTAVEQGEAVLPLPYPERVQKLGYVYVKVATEKAQGKVATVKAHAKVPTVKAHVKVTAEKASVKVATEKAHDKVSSVKAAAPVKVPANDHVPPNLPTPVSNGGPAEERPMKTPTRAKRKRSPDGKSSEPVKKQKIAIRSPPKPTRSTSKPADSKIASAPKDKEKTPKSEVKQRRRTPGRVSRKKKPEASSDPPTSAEDLLAKIPVLNVSHPAGADPIKDLHEDEFDQELTGSTDENGFGLGSLVWGRMAGFPYWPCFVTKSSEGEMSRESSKRGREYHVQFFNWNDESGWVRKAMPWKTLEEFRSLAQKIPKSNANEWKAWHPQGKMMEKKWMTAVTEAQGTADKTRKVRFYENVVSYRSDGEKAVQSPKARHVRTFVRGRRPNKKSLTNNNQRSGLARSGFSPITTEDILQPALPKFHPTTPNGGTKTSKYKFFKSKNPSGLNHSKTKSVKPRAKPGPMCSKPKKLVDSIDEPKGEKLPLMVTSDEEEDPIPALRTDAKVYGLPPQWKVIALQHGQPQYESPDGMVFNSIQNVLGHLFLQNMGPFGRKRSYSASSRHETERVEKGWFLERTDRVRHRVTEHTTHAAGILEGYIQYAHDLSLPKGWTLKRIRDVDRPFSTTLLYISPEPESECFNSKVSVANYLETKGHPAIEIEQILAMMIGSLPKPASQISGCSKRTRAEASALVSVDLGEGVQSLSNHATLGRSVLKSFVDMVQLPNVFLEHPNVRVTETPQEMVISDFFTGEFIAKKVTCEDDDQEEEEEEEEEEDEEEDDMDEEDIP